MEHIVSFMPGQLPHEERFTVELTGISYPDRNYHIVRPRSPIYCLEFVMSGSGTVRCGDDVFEPQGGDVYLLPATLDHDYRASRSDPFKKIWMNIRGDLCDSLYAAYGLAGRHLFPRCNALALFEQFLHLCEQHHDDGRILAEQCPIIVHRIFSMLSFHSDAAEQEYNSLAQKIKRYIDVHLQDNLQAKTVADENGISISQMTRIYAAEYGETPYQYYSRQRLRLIQSLLADTFMRSSEIARRLNFADEHYFCTWFKQRTGETPMQYRKRNNAR